VLYGLAMKNVLQRSRGGVFKLKERRFRLNVRRKFFLQRTVRPWHSCPEKLWVLKARLDGAWAAQAGGGLDD